jgi:hypothetical protein
MKAVMSLVPAAQNRPGGSVPVQSYDIAQSTLTESESFIAKPAQKIRPRSSSCMVFPTAGHMFRDHDQNVSAS